MSHPSSLLCFYTDRRDASAMRKQLLKNRIRRTALIYKAQDGRLRIDNFRMLHSVIWGAGIGFVGGSTAWLAAHGLGNPFTLMNGSLILVLATLTGAGLGQILFLGLGLGAADRIINKYSPRLTAGETVVVAQASPKLMGRAITVLLQGRNPQPAIFAFCARPEELQQQGHAGGESFSPDSLTHPAHRPPALQGSGVTSSGGREHILRLLDRSERVIGEVQRALADASRIEQSITATAEWILDNAHIVQTQIDDVRLNLPNKFYRQLPTLAANPGEPRVYRLAVEFVKGADGYINRHSIRDFLESCQKDAPLTIGELWVFPLMLKIALIDYLRRLTEDLHRDICDRQEADFWANRLLLVARRDPDRLFALLADLAQEQLQPSPHFVLQLTGHLYEEESILIPVVSWLKQKLANKLDEAVLIEKAAQTTAGASLENAITSLRLLILLDWREVFDEHSWVERKLSEDPAGVYARMDYETRNRYRNAVEEISRSGGRKEVDVAEAATALAFQAAREGDAARPGGHVGYYLIGRGRPMLTRRLEVREALRRRILGRIYQFHTLLYLGSIGGGTILFTGAVLALGVGFGAAPITLLLLALASLPTTSQISVQIVNYILCLLLPPRLLPKMSFAKGGVPDEFLTLVVIPMLLGGDGDLRREIEKLEIRYLANQDPNLVFGLFSDYADADTPQAAGDELLAVAVEGIKALNKRYGGQRFYLFHRERVWTASERSYIGWERKRGKLEVLNRLINGEDQVGEASIVRVGDTERLADIRFVITLDSDTQLLRDTARRLVETMAHPLNCPSPDGEGNPDAYTIVQPRVTTTPLVGMATPFRRLFTDPVGTDPYTRAVSDVYQDLTGEGSYIGKGIYDPRAFHRVLRGRFPEQRILSHDLLEGSHVRVALASDIELLDDFPADYLTYSNRQHRWIRGDWQIAGWCLSRVPGPDGQSLPNPLSIMNRWKILDNLRRSLTPAGLIAFLLASWFTTPSMALAAGAAAAVLVTLPLLSRVVTWITKLPGADPLSWAELGHDGLRVVAEMMLIPYQAGMTLDAIIRVWYRRSISGRHLLKWVSKFPTAANEAKRSRKFLALLALISLAAACLGGGNLFFQAGEPLPGGAIHSPLDIQPTGRLVVESSAGLTRPKKVHPCPGRGHAQGYGPADLALFCRFCRAGNPVAAARQLPDLR